MTILFYNKKDDEKFAYCGISQPGMSSTNIEMSEGVFIDGGDNSNFFWLAGFLDGWDIEKIGDKAFIWESQPAAVRFTKRQYDQERNGKTYTKTPTILEKCLYERLKTEEYFGIPASIELELGTKVKGFIDKLEAYYFGLPGVEAPVDTAVKIYWEKIITFNILEQEPKKFSVADATQFVEKKSNPSSFGKSGGKYKSINERLVTLSEVLECEPNISSCLQKIEDTENNEYFQYLIDLLKLS